MLRCRVRVNARYTAADDWAGIAGGDRARMEPQEGTTALCYAVTWCDVLGDRVGAGTVAVSTDLVTWSTFELPRDAGFPVGQLSGAVVQVEVGYMRAGGAGGTGGEKWSQHPSHAQPASSSFSQVRMPWNSPHVKPRQRW